MKNRELGRDIGRCAFSILVLGCGLLLKFVAVGSEGHRLAPITRDRPFDQGEIEERDRKLRTLMHETLEECKPEIQGVWRRVVAATRPEERKVLQSVTLDYSDDPTP